jgi:DNA (cytosine-5)-methyltransferase 1
VTITIGSLSSGYGGLEMALASWPGAGAIDVRWHSEIDPDASLVLKTHWPEVPNLGSFADDDFWERAERVHLMCGGIPCQPFSAAGRQLGEADARHLWPFWRRGIELHRPATIVFENVANLTRGKMRPTFDAIIADLLALGYDVRWCLLGACAVGAAHHRHRVFLLACRTRTTPNARQVTVQTCGQSVAAHLPTPSAVSYGSNQGGGAGRVGPVRHSLEALARLELLPTTRTRDWKIGGYADTLSSVAMTLLPSPQARDGREGPGCSGPEYSARRLAEGRRNLEDGVIAMLPTPRHSDAKNGGPNQGIASGDIALSSAVQPERWGKYTAAVARHAEVMGTLPPEPTEIGPRGGRRLAAAFSEWLMMLPAGHLTSVLDRNPALARAGNGVVPLQAATALRLLFEDLTGGA